MMRGKGHNVEVPAEDRPQTPRSWSFDLNVQVVDFLSGYTVAGVLEGFTPGEVLVSLGEAMSEQKAVSVHFRSFAFEGQVLYCQLRETRYEAHIAIAMESVFLFALVRHCRPLSDCLFRAGVEMQHLFEKPTEVPGDVVGRRFLGTVWGKRLSKAAPQRTA
jgi:hypothetical protein